jgi:Protein of unknown function (DUF3261)
MRQMSTSFRSLCAVALAAALTACGARAVRTTEPAAWPLVAPSAVAPRAVSQVVRAAYGRESVTLQSALTVNATELSLVGLTATGQRAFTVRYDGKALDVQRAFFVPNNIDPQRVLADVQLALWPLDELQPAWRRAGFEVSEPLAGMRRVMRGDRLVAEVHYASDDPWSGRFWLVNFELDYSIAIENEPAE